MNTRRSRPPHPPSRRSVPQGITRRDLLGLAGMGALASALTCAGGALGYLALDRLAQTNDHPVRGAVITPDASVSRPGWLKEIDRPPIITRADWGARAPDHAAINEAGDYSLANPEGWRDYGGDLRAAYQTVVVHHSVEYETDDPATMRAIQDLHMDDNGWADIGYHFGVGKQGGVYEGRSLAARGTHVERYNTGSVGVVFLGDFETELPTQIQIDTGRRLIDWLALRLELTHLAGHRDFNDFTQCPGVHLYPYLAAFALSAGLMLGTDGYEPPAEQLTPTATP